VAIETRDQSPLLKAAPYRARWRAMFAAAQGEVIDGFRRIDNITDE